MPLAPVGESVADPQPGRSADDRMRHAVGQRIAPTCRAGLEHRPGDVPLEEMDLAARTARNVYELMNEKALARSGEPGDEDHVPVGQCTDALGEPAIGA